MEFNFADSLFDIEEEKFGGTSVKQIYPDYTPKLCVDNWFADVYADNYHCDEDYYFALKHQADLLYYRQDFSEALKKYNDYLQFELCLKNQSMLREVYDSIIRCYLKLNVLDLAEESLKYLVELRGNSNDCSVYLLAFQIYVAKGMHEQAVHQLIRLIDINTANPKHWLSLYHVLRYLHNEGNEMIELYNDSCILTEELLYALLLQGKFFLEESLRGQSNEKKLQFKPMMVEIRKNMDICHGKVASLNEKIKLEFNMPGDNCQDRCLEKNNYFQKWLKICEFAT